MRGIFKDFFHFSKGERNGIILLFIIILIFIAAPAFIPFFIKEPEIDFTTFQKEIEAFEKQNIHVEAGDSAETFVFYFDPNEITAEEWRRLGFSEKNIRTITNYRSKGGIFKTPDDLLKIYGIDSALYFSIKPYVDIKKRETFSEDKQNFYEKRKNEFHEKRIEEPVKNFSIELNSADTTELKELRGIGSAFARRIVHYRESLGGFIHKEQLLEVYGMDSVRYAQIEPFIEVDEGAVRKINISRAEISELQKHPYIDYNLAKAIYNYNRQHTLTSADDMKNIYIMDEKTLKKITPYVFFEK